MRRALNRALRAVLLFVLPFVVLPFLVGAMAGLDVSSRIAPRKLRSAVEASLSEALGTPVSIASARLLVFPGVSVEATNVAAWNRATTPAFMAERLEAGLDPAALVAGRLRFSSIRLDGVTLALERAADGSWTPPLLTPGLENPLTVLGRLFAAELPAPSLEIRSGSLSITDMGAPRARSARARFAFDDISLRLLAPGLLSSGRLVASGTLRQTQEAPARFELESAAARGRTPTLELAASGLALDRLLPYLRVAAPGLALGGAVSGVLTLVQPDSDSNTTDLSFDLSASSLRAARSENEWKQFPVSVERSGVRGALRIAPKALTLSDGALRADDLALSLAGSLELPVEDEARLALEAQTPGLDVAGLARLAAWLPADARRSVEAALRPLTSGRLEDLSLSGAATLDAWQAAARPGGPWLPDAARLGARLVDIALSPKGEAPVSAIRGSVLLEGPDTLTLSGLEGRLGASVLPVLDLRLDGLHHLLAEAAGALPAVPALPGRLALEALLRGQEEDDASPGWSALEVDADWIQHPAFFRSLRGVKARLEPTPDGVRIRVAQGSWGGVPIHGEGELALGAPERVRLSLVAEAPAGAGDTGAAAANWAHGRFAVSAPARPGFHVASLRGGFDCSGSRLTIFDAAAELGIPGRLTGDARLDLGTAGEVPAELRLSLDEARVGDVLSSLSDEPSASSGSVDISARLAGPLRPGVRLLSALSGDARITARDGELAVELPLLLAIAKASTTFNPFGSARGIRFDRIDAELQLTEGRLATRQGITIESPDLRLVLSGSVDLRQSPHPLEAVVGCFFFKPLDQVLGAMPVVSRILLGPDRSLFGTFFALTGSWEDPQAGLIPTRTVVLGPASFLMQDVPAFVKRGLEAIQGLLPGLGGGPPAVASPAESADPEGDGS